MAFAVIFILVSCNITRAAGQSVEDVPYPQKWITKYSTAEGLPDAPAISLAICSKKLFAGTGQGLYVFAAEKWLPVNSETGAVNDIACAASGNVLAAAEKGLFDIKSDVSAEIILEGPAMAVASSGGKIFAATEAGFAIVENGAADFIPGTEGLDMRAIAIDADGVPHVATVRGIIEIHDGGFESINEGNSDLLSDDVRDISIAADGALVISTARGINIVKPGGGWEILTGKNGGLPYEDVTAAVFRNDEKAVATKIGAAHFDGEIWHYFQSGRYLPEDAVNDVIFGPEGEMWFATDGGVSKIEYRMMTLEEKAAIYQSTLHERHNRLDFIGDSPLAVPGDYSTVYQKTHDNENVWTGMYVAAECFRYAATGNDESLQLARNSMEALLKLDEITGVKGYFARSYAPIGFDVGQGGEWHETPDGKFLWKSDTSSDEIVGRFFGLSTYYDFCANEDEKKRISATISDTMNYIIDNDYYFLDIDGEPTTWGKWNPDFFKTDGKFQKNLNSLEILSFLRTAYHVDPDERFMDEYKKLIKEYGYAKNAVKSKLFQPGIQNHSDDLLAFLSYYPLIRYETHPKLLDEYFLKSIRRTMKYIKETRNPNWNFIYCAVTPEGDDGCDIEGAIWTLRRMPVNLIYWKVKNSHRTDIEISEYDGMRKDEKQGVKPLPPDERFMLKFNENPYRLDGYWNADNSEPPSFWLLPYWMGRYYGFIK